jgi:hypothetical protein
VASEKNPVEDYLEKKSDFFGPAARGVLRGAKDALQGGVRAPFSGSRMGEELGGTIMHGAIGVAGAGAASLAALGVHKLYDAATKTRDFKSMLEYAPDIAEMHAENPQQVNQMFSTLRTFNPDFTRDPVVASNYVRRMVNEPVGAGGIATEALQSRDKMKHPYSDTVLRAAIGGGGKKK